MLWSTLWLFGSALVLGFVFNAAPGPVLAETVRQGVRGGYRAALAVQIGSLAGDALWALLGLLGIGLLLQLEFLRWPVAVAGILYLLWLARDSWLSSRQVFTPQDSAARVSTRALRAGALLSLTNPQNVAYWAALGSALGSLGIADPTARDYAVFFAGFMTSSVLWSFICAAAVARMFRGAGTKWSALAYRLCAVGFLCLALASTRDLISGVRQSTPHSVIVPR